VCLYIPGARRLGTENREANSCPYLIVWADGKVGHAGRSEKAELTGRGPCKPYIPMCMWVRVYGVHMESSVRAAELLSDIMKRSK